MGTFNGYVKQCRVRNVLCSQNQLIEYSLEEKLNIRIRNFYSEKQNMKELAPYSQQPLPCMLAKNGFISLPVHI